MCDRERIQAEKRTRGRGVAEPRQVTCHALHSASIERPDARCLFLVNVFVGFLNMNVFADSKEEAHMVHEDTEKDRGACCPSWSLLCKNTRHYLQI